MFFRQHTHGSNWYMMFLLLVIQIVFTFNQDSMYSFAFMHIVIEMQAAAALKPLSYLKFVFRYGLRCEN